MVMKWSPPCGTRPLALRGGEKTRDTFTRRSHVKSYRCEFATLPYRNPYPRRSSAFARLGRKVGARHSHRTRGGTARPWSVDTTRYRSLRWIPDGSPSTDARQTRRLLRPTPHRTHLTPSTTGQPVCPVPGELQPQPMSDRARLPQISVCAVLRSDLLSPLHLSTIGAILRTHTNRSRTLPPIALVSDGFAYRTEHHLLLHTRGRRLSAPTHGCFARRLPSDWHVRGHGITVR